MTIREAIAQLLIAIAHRISPAPQSVTGMTCIRCGTYVPSGGIHVCTQAPRWTIPPIPNNPSFPGSTTISGGDYPPHRPFIGSAN